MTRRTTFYRLLGRDHITPVDKVIAMLAHEEYAAQGHSQPFEKVQKRGGFSDAELIALLADRVMRLQSQK